MYTHERVTRNLRCAVHRGEGGGFVDRAVRPQAHVGVLRYSEIAKGSSECRFLALASSEVLNSSHFATTNLYRTIEGQQKLDFEVLGIYF